MHRAELLIVEDDEDTREALAVFLRHEGYEVATACGGAEALRQLRQGLAPGLIILDLNMPDKNGQQFRTEQVLDPRIEAIPVVTYTGDPDFYAASIRLGAVACLRKPIEPDQLLEIVKQHCPKPTV
jgi:CheY-like chemotaxis protein